MPKVTIIRKLERMLASNPSTIVSDADLFAACWPSYKPFDPTTLKVTVSQLRRMVSSWAEISRLHNEGYVLIPHHGTDSNKMRTFVFRQGCGQTGKLKSAIPPIIIAVRGPLHRDSVPHATRTIICPVADLYYEPTRASIALLGEFGFNANTVDGNSLLCSCCGELWFPPAGTTMRNR